MQQQKPGSEQINLCDRCWCTIKWGQINIPSSTAAHGNARHSAPPGPARGIRSAATPVPAILTRPAARDAIHDPRRQSPSRQVVRPCHRTHRVPDWPRDWSSSAAGPRAALTTACPVCASSLPRKAASATAWPLASASQPVLLLRGTAPRTAGDRPPRARTACCPAPSRRVRTHQRVRRPGPGDGDGSTRDSFRRVARCPARTGFIST